MESSPCATEVSASARLRKAELSTLESDVALLKCMQDLSQKMVSQADKLVRDLQQLEKDSIAACVGVENCVQNLNLISTKQYMEKRVYDEEIKEIKEDTNATATPVTNNPPDFVPKIKEALSHVLPVVRTNSKLVPNQNGGKHRPLNEADYSLRPLPWIVGTSEFLECPLVGLPFTSDEQNGNTDIAPASAPDVLLVTERRDVQQSSSSLSEYSETEEASKTPVFSTGPSEVRRDESEDEIEPPVDDRQTKPQSSFAVLQKELASKFKVPIIPSESESPPEQESSRNESPPSQPRHPVFSQKPVALPRSEQNHQQQQQQSYQQYQQVVQKRRTLFDDSSDSDDDDLFKAAASQPVQPPAAKSFVSTPVPAPVPVFIPRQIPEPIPPPSSVPTAPIPAPIPTTSQPVQSSILPSAAPIKPTNGGSSGRSFLFESSDEDDDLFSTSKTAGRNVSQVQKPPIDDDDDDLFSSHPIAPKAPAVVPVASPAVTSSTVPSTAATIGPKVSVSVITSPTVPATVVKSENSGAKSSSFFEDDDDDLSKIFPVSSTPQKVTPTVSAPTTSTAPTAVPKRVIATSLFGNDSDSDDDIFKNIIPKKPAATKTPPSRSAVTNEPTESAPTPKVNPQVQNHVNQSLNSQVSKTSFPPKPVSVPTPQTESKPFKSDVSPAPAPALVPKDESVFQKENASTESDGRSPSVKRPTTLSLSDDSDDDLFKPQPVNKAAPVAAIPAPPTSAEKAANVGFLKTPEEEEKESDKPSSPGGLIASLKLSLAKQPMGMLSPSSSSQTPSTPGMRKPFAGVPIFGIPPTSPLAPVAKQVSPEKEEAPVSQPSGDESLPCLGRDRPRAPKHRRLPSRSHRRSMILEENEVMEPTDQTDGEKQVPNGSVASTPVSPVPAADIQVPVTEKPAEVVAEPVHELPVPINDHPVSQRSGPMTEDFAPKAEYEVPVAAENHSAFKSEPLPQVLTKESEPAVNPAADKPKEPGKLKTSLFNDSDDSSDGELFAKLAKPAPVTRVANSQAKSAQKVEIAAPQPPPPAPAKASTQSLFGEDSDSDDGLFVSRKITTASAAAPAKKPSGFQAFADSDSDDDNLFASKPAKRGPPDRTEAAKANVERTGDPAVISDPLLGFYDQ